MPELPPSWRDHRDAPVAVPPPPGGDARPFYAAIGDFQAAAYRRNAFAQATEREASALRNRLRLGAGTRVLDVGCGNGRHLLALATDGITGVGIDASAELLAAAERARPAGASVRFVLGDARDLVAVRGLGPGSFDVVWCLSQGGLGTHPRTDRDVVAGMAALVRPDGRVVFTVFHALFAARHLQDGDAYDPVHGVHHHLAEVRGPDEEVRWFDLWSTAYTVREAVDLARGAGLDVEAVVGAEPGRYDGAGVALDDPELLVLARRPA